MILSRVKNYIVARIRRVMLLSLAGEQGREFFPSLLSDYFGDIDNMCRIISTMKSSEFVLENMRTMPALARNVSLTLENRYELLTYCISRIESDGLFLEFGVYKGKTINHIASLVPDRIVYGFDSFEGLPEDWISGYPRGHFELKRLPTVQSNAQLVIGLFQETLEPFLEEQGCKVACVQVDSDVYSSARYVLLTLARHNALQEGTVIQFDEFFNYPGWWIGGEYKAFLEFVEEFDVEFEYLGYVPTSYQLAVKILKISSAQT